MNAGKRKGLGQMSENETTEQELARLRALFKKIHLNTADSELLTLSQARWKLRFIYDLTTKEETSNEDVHFVGGCGYSVCRPVGD